QERKHVEDLDSYIKSLNEDVRIKLDVEDKIYKFVESEHFKLEQPQEQEGGFHGKFGDYKIKKIEKNIRSKGVNILYEEPTSEILFHQHLCEETCFTYCRGNKPSKWSDFYNYVIEEYHYIFVDGDLSKPICDYRIEKMETKQTSKTTPEETQTKVPTSSLGGSKVDYFNKYLKYKSKYMNFKKNFY
ncbi:MAG: hypothetical protein QW303_02715, partial [Nitrososphaerota archaeon]